MLLSASSKKRLIGSRVRMRCLNGEKLSAARADHSDDIDAQMAAISGHSGFSALFVPAFSGTRIPLKA